MPSARSFSCCALLSAAIALAASPQAHAQTFESVGTRATGMGGAFVAVADDASAVYWNPAGLALGGAFFSLVIDQNFAGAEPDLGPADRRRSTLVAFSTLPIGLSYYRLASTTVAPVTTAFAATPVFRVERLTTHHGGVTLVQSITSSIAVASTLKFVRGTAAAGIVIDGDRDTLLEEGGIVPEAASTKFDADIGVMASYRRLRAGLTVRNVTQPDFDTPSGGPVSIDRQTRAGVSFRPDDRFLLAADVDLERTASLRGESRNVAVGAEARLGARAFVRTGFRVNTIGDQPGGRGALYSVGATCVTFRSLMIDGQATFGSDRAGHAWGVAARLVY
jgi:hypothetical protein